MELIPCPFCGGDKFAFGGQIVFCLKCHVFVTLPYVMDERHEYQDPKDTWNTRAERTCELNGSISLEWHTTSTTFYTHSLSCGHNVTTTEQEPPCYCEECGAKVVES